MIYELHYYSTLVANDIALRLDQLCESLQTLSSSTRHTIILQTGSWDLSLGALFKLLELPNAAKLLFHKLEQLEQDELPCGGVSHLIWMTTVPYPLGYRRYGTGQDERQSYRSNTAIAAWNMYAIEAIRNISRKSKRMKVSLVDAFSILKPRLIFDQNFEVVCINHYLCRHERMRNLAITLGGSAVLEALIDAAVT
jgi:hypothetical protein